MEKTRESLQIQERMDHEISKLRSTSDREVQRVKDHTKEMHDREVAVLTDRVSQLSRERDDLQTRLLDEEQRRQEAQVAFSSVQSRLSAEIVELQGQNRLKQFELDKLSLAYQEL